MTKLFEGLLNPNIQFSPAEWRELIVNPLATMSSSKERTLAERMLQCLARVPEITQRVRRNLHHQTHFLQARFVAEAGAIYDEAVDCLNGLRTAYLSLASKVQASGKSLSDTTCAAATKADRLNFVFYADSQRLYGLALFTAGYINKLIRSFHLENSSHDFEAEAAGFVSEIIALAEASRPFRPLGAACMPCNLVVAWMNVRPEDHATRRLVEGLHRDYSSDFPETRAKTICESVSGAEWIWPGNKVTM